ncbi:MAG: translational GTPase TypA [Chlamydiota bacterium]
MQDPKKIRNIAIVAHIDHGKTTLLDTLLKQSNIFRDNEKVPERIMDSYDQEQERGITIFAKHTSMYYQDYKINVIDTPGHADFSGEVERILGMVQSVLLLVDAAEGPMPQTRFVLSQSLKFGLRPIVILNKIDRAQANPDRALDLTFDLFVELGATPEQLDFPYIYASGISGFAISDLNDERKNLEPLFQLIVDKVSPPSGNIDLPFLMQVSTVFYDEFVGRQGCGRILEGKIRKADFINRVDREGKHSLHRLGRIDGFLGLKKIELPEATVGDIILLSGIPDVNIGDTICSSDTIVQLPPITLTEPTLSIEVMVNSSPLSGKEGKFVTMNKIKDRLFFEKKANISLKIEEVSDREDAMKVCGRGELHLAVLLEAMRREGFEFTASKPQVLTKVVNGIVYEPIESVHVEVPERFSGTVIEDLSRRKGEMQTLSTNEQGITSLQFFIPTRTLLGYRSDFLNKTSGLGILTSCFENYAPWKGAFQGRMRGVMVASCGGKVNGFACFNLQERGTLFVKPGDVTYEGMVVGENSRENDLIVNPTKEKHLTNVRASGNDENIILTPPRLFTLEQSIEYIQDDEYVEITPKSIRIRKKYLSEIERRRK